MLGLSSKLIPSLRLLQMKENINAADEGLASAAKQFAADEGLPLFNCDHSYKLRTVCSRHIYRFSTVTIHSFGRHTLKTGTPFSATS